jgi:UDP-GlcNAc:undecaprenyl-phosphate GlcNAc-1-phosphate transferase
VGIFLAVHVAAVSRDGLDVALLVASGIVLVLGLIDDRVGLGPAVRLVVELGAALVLVVMTPYTESGAVFVVLAVLVVVTAVNSVNLYDGLDGLAGSSALVTALGLAWLLSGRGLGSVPPIELAMAIGGFLVLNWHPAKVFLGDGGSYVIGLTLAHMILSSGDSTGDVIVALGLFGVFAIDLLASIARRLLSGGPLFAGDRAHLYDQLRERGLGVSRVALASGVAQGTLVAAVVLVDRSMTAWAGVAVLIALMMVIMGALARAGFLSVGSG